MTLESYFKEWMKVIDKKELLKVINELAKVRNTICPELSNIFRAFELCPYNELKVVFIGQDPYPQKGVATGILFGNKKEVGEEDLSPSLKVVKEAAINFEVPHDSIIFDQTLEEWAKQGILMINSSLTVLTGKVGSHTMLWRPFMGKLLSNLSMYNTGIIYVLFGEQAKTLKPYIDNKNNIIITEKHPAYYARTETRMPSYIFEEVSRITKANYGEPIKWFNMY